MLVRAYPPNVMQCNTVDYGPLDEVHIFNWLLIKGCYWF